MLNSKDDHHVLSLIGLFLLLLSPIVWIVLSGESLKINQNPTFAWGALTTFAIVAYIAFLAFVGNDHHIKKQTKKSKK